jgi:hypothetical protein
MREKLIELMCEAKRLDPETGSFSEFLADHLIANGVTITPAVPGPKMGHDMSEVCYRNGGEAMREKVVELLKGCKAVAFGARRDEIQDMIEKVRKL